MGTGFRNAVVVCILFLATNQVALAQGSPRIVRIFDGVQPRCVDPGTDQVYLTLRRLITQKSQGWLRKDTEVAVILNVDVGVEGESAPIPIPLALRAPLSGYAKGQVALPIEHPIVQGLRLTQGDTRYTGFLLEITVLNQEGLTPWGRALQALFETAEKMPLPENPVSLAADYLFKVARLAIDGDLQDQHRNDKVSFATMALNFDPTGQCSGPGGLDFESTGTLAVVGPGGRPGPGYVDLSPGKEYCWQAQLKPSFMLKAAAKPLFMECNNRDVQLTYAPVTNDYLAFFLNAVQVQNRAGLSPFISQNIQSVHAFTSRFDADRTVSLARCRANGIAEDQCFGEPVESP
jgi:hypothetical protein